MQSHTSDIYNTFVRADTHTNGRYANQFIRAMAAHFISQKMGARPLYPPINLEKLGINLYQPSNGLQGETQRHESQVAQNIINLEETTFMDYMRDSHASEITTAKLQTNTILDLNHIYCQTPEHALKINDFLRQPENQMSIIRANPHRDRYAQNNDVFIHVRLGDVPHHNPGYEYYNSVLSALEFTNGYISSDTINHPICRKLIHKYRLQIINPHAPIEDILQFGSTCKTIVLSAGTFSWLFGMLGFESQVYYPDPALKRRWHGDIFECMPGWNKMSY